MQPDIIFDQNQEPLVSPPVVDFSNWLVVFLQWLADIFPYFVILLKNILGILIAISIPISIVFLIVIVYSVERLKAIRKKEEQVFDLKVEPAYEMVDEDGKKDEALAKRWQVVATHIESDNPNDWKQAIMEADIMLDDVLTKLGYQGDGVGEKLKRAEPADFGSLNDAWEAHKVRNQIAHEGSSYQINQIEAKRVIQMYRKVFEEFYYL